MKLKNIIYAGLILLFGAFITYRIISNKNKNDNPKDNGGKNKPMNVTGIIVKTETFDNNLSLSGSLEANEQVEIRSEISGIVEGIYFKEGSNVAKGQLLLKVNDIELRAQLAQAKTRGGLSSENERRAKLLLEKEAISQEEFDVARADYKLAVSQIQLIQAQIAKTSVRAPFSGKIGLRSISPGTYITPSVMVAKLVNISKLKITFSIPEKYANQVRQNTTVSFTVSGSTEKYNAIIYAIEPEVEISTRTLQIRAIADNVNGKLLPGIFANVELPLDIIKDAIVIPSESIIPIQNGKKVFISNNGKAKEIKIKTTARTDSSVLVLSGLKAGDTLITGGMMSLKDDTAVKVKVK